jgi:pimeloyl-ACP methyl ester carboxylesterase
LSYWNHQDWNQGVPWRERRPLRTRTIVVIAIVVGLVAGLVTATTTSSSLAAKTLVISDTQSIGWQSCGIGHGYTCADVGAPLDWSDPGSSSIHLTLVRHAATGTKYGSLLVNPGGPGGSGVGFVASGVTNAVTPAVAKHYDVIGFDPRGVGYSSAVKCDGAKELDRYLYTVLPGTIGSPEWIAADKLNASRFAKDCASDTGALLGHVDTVSAARDLELIRADLGEPRLNYLGYSYGTELGSVYAGLYPSHVGRFVLDGALDIWSDSGSAGVVDQAKGFEGDLRAWMAACEAGKPKAVGSATCPFSGTVDQGMTRVRALLSKVSDRPQQNADGRQLGGATLATAIVEALYSTSEWPRLTAMFTATLAGKPAKAFALADQYNGRTKSGKYVDNSTEAFTAIGCLDSGGGVSVASMKRQATRLEKAAPTLGPYQAYGDMTCDAWKYGAVAYPSPPTGSGQDLVLVVGTTGDPATPYQGAKELAKLLPTGHLVTYVGEGHTAYDLGHSCVDDTVDAYLLHATVPKSDPRCH